MEDISFAVKTQNLEDKLQLEKRNRIESRILQANLILPCFTLLCFADVFFTSRRQDSPRAKRLQLTLLQYLLHRGGLEPNPEYL